MNFYVKFGGAILHDIISCDKRMQICLNWFGNENYSLRIFDRNLYQFKQCRVLEGLELVGLLSHKIYYS